jgi:uncharacterized protein (TIGR03085 family)
VQRTLAQRTPFGGLVAAIRNGPPRLSPMRVAALDERTNLVEFFVHHEDIRRGAPGWTERKLTPALAEALWHQLGNARLFLHRAPVGVEFARDDVDTDPGAERVRITVKQRTPVVTVIGSPAELTLWALGRTGAAQVRLDGSEAAVRLLSERRWRRR